MSPLKTGDCRGDPIDRFDCIYTYIYIYIYSSTSIFQIKDLQRSTLITHKNLKIPNENKV